MSKPGAPPTEEDLEATAELPAIDFAPMERDPDKTLITDFFVTPAIPVGAPELADNLREVEQQLHRERARIQDMEAQLIAAGQREAVLQVQLADASAQQSEFEIRLATATRQCQDLEARLAEAARHYSALGERLAEADARYEAIEVHLQSRPVVEPMAPPVPRESADMAALRRCSARQLEALATWYGFRGLSDSLLAESEARNAQLEAEAAKLGDSLRALERRHHAAAPVLQPVPPREGENQALKSELAALKSEFGQLQAVLLQLRERQQQSEQQAAAESQRARRLENEVQANVAQMAPPRNVERPARENAAWHAATQMLPNQGPLRVLIRLQGGAEVVYPVGRRTTIGRMPDNDIQLDTTNVSRHHAVLLSNAEHCIVEDLNSTNGVLVNGQRVGRHLLHDGDILSVGKTEFRFQQRP
jgi:predicted  nucleic acid-binding Zn-ribbon protein